MPSILPRARRAAPGAPGVVPGLPEGWLGPARAGGWTGVGSLDATVEVHVDPRGLVTVPAGWSLDWWIGAEDRWHVPAREAGGVRQSLLDATPVVETRVRVPSGDAVQRTYGVRGGDGRELVVVEVENAGSVPFALALAVRPYGPAGPVAVGEIVLDGAEVRVDGAPGLVLPRPPAHSTASSAAADSAAVVLAGDAAIGPHPPVRCAEGLAQSAYVFPLAHTAVLRVVLPVGPEPAGRAPDPAATGGSGRSWPGRRGRRGVARSASDPSPSTVPPAPPSPAAVPAAARTARGWRTQDERAPTRVVLPDARLQDALDANRRYLRARPVPVDPLARAEVVLAAGGWGLSVEASAWAVDLAEVPELAGDAALRVLEALVGRWSLDRDVELVAALVPTLAGLAEQVGASAGPAGAHVLAELGAALAAVGERRAAADLAARPVAGHGPTGPRGGAEGPGALVARLVERASPTWTWASGTEGHDAATGAAFATAMRALLVAEPAPGTLDVAPEVPAAWEGQGWEVHGLPTAAGRLGYAVRWHGARPALLWDLEPHPGTDPPRLVASGLDPGWSATAARGEALLRVGP